jgi:hypothetical protein
MNNHKVDDKYYGILMALGLTGVIMGVWSEAVAIWEVEQNWARLFSAVGIVALSLYLLLLLIGLFFLTTSLIRVETVNQMAGKLPLPITIRGLIVAGLFLLYTYIYLFSVWQPSLSQPWIQTLFAMGLTQIILFVVAPQREQRFGWSEFALALSIFLYPRLIQEIRALFANAMVYRAATAAGFVLLMGLVFVLYSAYSEKLRINLLAWRERLGSSRFGMILLLCLAPIFHRYLVHWETYVIYDDIRFAIFMVVVWLVAYLGSTGSGRLVSGERLGLSLGVLLCTSFLARSSLFVIDYPFSLSWSEGNRFYDYSLVFGESLYNYSSGHILNPYSSPGRYGLWGILFLWQGLPIWVHRLWNLVLLTLPPLIFAALLTRKLRPAVLRYGTLLWITLFLTVLAPLHPPFVIASAIAVLFAFDESLIKRGSSLAVASYYAALSRWTWAFAPAAIGVLIDLMLYYPKRTGPLWRRLLPSLILAGVSLVAGLLPSSGQYFSLVQGEALSSDQPLLWYRLLPNDTLGPGVLFLALRYTLPLWIILGWWMFSSRWQLDWIQKLAITGALIGFFAIGLVISTKIGGGGDLHNLDMFLVTLLVVTVLWLTFLNLSSVPTSWPAWSVGLIAFLMFWVVYPFTPLHPGSDHHPRLDLANENRVSEAFSAVSEKLAKYSRSGEVLFMDHRQLLTFGYVPAIPFVPEYEKKYMMDQAMANNAGYFHAYYQDLAKQRFALIVTEPLRTKRREELGGPFSEENDAWVVWVSNPTLCFYEPVYESTEVNVELLVPKQNPLGCEQYLE